MSPHSHAPLTLLPPQTPSLPQHLLGHPRPGGICAKATSSARGRASALHFGGGMLRASGLGLGETGSDATYLASGIVCEMSRSLCQAW